MGMDDNGENIIKRHAPNFTVIFTDHHKTAIAGQVAVITFYVDNLVHGGAKQNGNIHYLAIGAELTHLRVI